MTATLNGFPSMTYREFPNADHREVIRAAQDIGEPRLSGNVYTAVHVEGRIAVCGGAMALGKAVSERDHEFQTIVAVAHPHPHTDKMKRLLFQ